MAERLGRRLPLADSAVVARARRLSAAVWFVAVVAIALVAAAVVAVIGHDNNPLHAEIRGGFGTGDPTAFTVSYQVTKSTLATSECELQAQDAEHEVVGTLIDVVRPTGSNRRTTVHRVAIPTTRQAVTAQIARCHLLHTS